MARVALLLFVVLLRRGRCDMPSAACCMLCSSSERFLAGGSATTTLHLTYPPPTPPQRCTVAGSPRRASIQGVIQRDSRSMCAGAVKVLPPALPQRAHAHSAAPHSPPHPAHARSSSSNITYQRFGAPHSQPPSLPPPHPHPTKKIETVIQGGGSSRN